MRQLRIVAVIAGAVCALAVAAAPAMAHEFIASKTGKSTGRGFEEIPVEPHEAAPEFEPARMQDWTLGNFKIDCYKALSKGEVTETHSETFTTTIKFSRCGWYPEVNSLHVSATFSKSGLTVVYHANGYGVFEGNGEGEEVEYKKAEIRETAAYFKVSSTHLCKIIIPEQTIPVRAVRAPNEEFSAVTYSNEEVPVKANRTFPNGLQQRIVITNELKGILFKYGAEGEEPETQCHNAPEFEKTAEEGGGKASGKYKGSLEEWIPGGNLRYE